MKIKTMHTTGYVTDTVNETLIQYGLELSKTIYLLDNILEKGEVCVYATHEEEQQISKLRKQTSYGAYLVLDYIRGNSFLKKELETAFKVIEKYQAKHDRLP